MQFMLLDLFCIDKNSINLTCLTYSLPTFDFSSRIYNSKHTLLLIVNHQGENEKKKRKEKKKPKLQTVKQPC